MDISLNKRLRQNQTPWETKLWQVLRSRKLKSLKFRRQYKIGRYIVDFCCLSLKLVIEVDGGQHNTDDLKIKDKERQRYIESQGYQVLRFWNNEINNNLDGVVERIIQVARP